MLQRVGRRVRLVAQSERSSDIRGVSTHAPTDVAHSSISSELGVEEGDERPDRGADERAREDVGQEVIASEDLQHANGARKRGGDAEDHPTPRALSMPEEKRRREGGRDAERGRGVT